MTFLIENDGDDLLLDPQSKLSPHSFTKNKNAIYQENEMTHILTPYQNSIYPICAFILFFFFFFYMSTKKQK
jgi:hypothetical protein